MSLAASAFGEPHSVFTTPLPADPPTDASPPTVQQGEYYDPNDPNDWRYHHSATGGG